MCAVTRKRTIVLDAMGVIFRAQDDVVELLLPFLRSHGSSVDENDLLARYEKASLGVRNVDDFWRSFGLDPSVEDEYLASHELNDGVLDFLEFARKDGIDVWCLSNDVSRWSQKLRKRFALESLFVDFVISGDIGVRKPAEQAYRGLIDRIGYVPDLFVDDRARNVLAAESVGISSLRFGIEEDNCNSVLDFEALRSMLRYVDPK